jgi:hypothetical protein
MGFDVPKSLCDNCYVHLKPSKAAPLVFKAFEMGHDYMLADELPEPPSAELKARLFAFAVHVHSYTKGQRAKRQQLMREFAFPDSRWIAESVVEDWTPGPSRKWKVKPWADAQLAYDVYMEFAKFVNLMDRLYEWHGAAERREDKKAEDCVEQLRWCPKTHKKLLQHFFRCSQISKEMKTWINEYTPRGRFIRHYLAHSFRLRLCRDKEDGVLLHQLHWLVGYSKLA